MLRPHHREDAELSEPRVATKRLDQLPVFFGGQTVLSNDVRGETLLFPRRKRRDVQ
jgi:hypothetical protein